MKTKARSLRAFARLARAGTAILCAFLLVPGEPLPAAQEKPSAPAPKTDEPSGLLPADQLDSLVAPIALYPDPMLAQVLAASTYPLELIQLQQWLAKNPKLKDKALVDAVSKQPWDPSIQAMAALPEVVKRLADDIQWTTELGNAFLAQQSDVMEAVQRMRKKAKDAGNLKSNEQQKVETETVESKQVIVIQQSNPEVVYVPSYNPVVVYGPPIYPYPPIYYPPPGYYAAGVAISFGIGVAMGAAWGGGWGWGCGWGHNDVNINVDNNFNRNTNINGGDRNNINNGNRTGNNSNRTGNNSNRAGNTSNRAGGGSGNKWQHNSQHRGGTPYSNKATAQQYGGTSRGDSMSNRQASARQNQSQQQRNRPQTGTSDRSGGNRGSSGGDRVGNRSTSSGASNRSSSGLGGGGMNGNAARASSSRGSASMGGGRSRSGGGGRRR